MRHKFRRKRFEKFNKGELDILDLLLLPHPPLSINSINIESCTIERERKKEILLNVKSIHWHCSFETV